MSVRKLLVGIASTAAVALFPASALANNVTISGSMEGAIHISNGDFVAAGYQFAFMGSHPEAHVLMANAQVTFAGTCSNGSSANTLTLPLRSGAVGGGPYDIAANDTSTHPGSNEQDADSFQGSVVANVCGGSGNLDASSGATFSATLKSDVTANDVHVQFHYRDPNAKGKGNFDCSAANYAASICGASWSGTASIKPDLLPNCATGQTLDSNGNCVTPPPTCPTGQTLNANGQCVTPPPTCPAGQTLGSNGQCTPPATPPTTTPPTATPPATPAGGVSPSKAKVKAKAKVKKKSKKVKRVRRRRVRHVVPHFTG